MPEPRPKWRRAGWPPRPQTHCARDWGREAPYLGELRESTGGARDAWGPRMGAHRLRGARSLWCTVSGARSAFLRAPRLAHLVVPGAHPLPAPSRRRAQPGLGAHPAGTPTVPEAGLAGRPALLQPVLASLRLRSGGRVLLQRRGLGCAGRGRIAKARGEGLTHARNWL